MNAQTNIAHADKVIIDQSRPASMLPAPQQIPQYPKDFTGRDEDIKGLLDQFGKGATITGLRGMGGVGKTALALVLADRLKDRFPDGRLYLEMQGTSKNPLKPEEAMAHVIRSYQGLDVKLPADQNGLGGLYRSVLSGKRALILLDNTVGRAQVEPLLPPPDCALLVTSRSKFTLPGLNEKDLDVLHLEDAKKLLLDICGRISEHAGELAEMCGCLPLALRNAASVLREKPNIGVARYIERLADARKRTELVEASFDLSYQLLTPGLQKLWCLLSVFPADFDLLGAAAVLDLENDAAEEALGELVKWSLVEFLPYPTGEGGRYMLHDLARVFSDSRLVAGAREPAQLSHAKHYKKILSRVDELYAKGGTDYEVGLDLFNIEWTNIKAGQKWIEDMIISKSAKTESVLQLACDYPAEGAYAMEVLLNPCERIHWLETAILAAQNLKDSKMEGSHLGNLGIAYCQIGEVVKAINIFQQRLSISLKIGDIFGESNSIGNFGIAYAMIGETSKSIEFFKRHLSIAKQNGDLRGESNDLGNLGLAYLNLGNSRLAIDYFGKSLAINRAIGNRKGEGANLGNLGQAYDLLGDQINAIEYYEQSLKISREIGDRYGEGKQLNNKSISFKKLGKTAEAMELANKALEIYMLIESPEALQVRQRLSEWQK